MPNNLWLNNPLVNSMLFFPRRVRPNSSTLNNVTDGTLPVNGANISYRYYHLDNAQANLLCFHGNAEAAADSDYVAPFYHRIGLSVLVVDYRGYGWSDGRPSAGHLLPDAEAIFHQLSSIISTDKPLFALGRSLGGASAIHLAYTFPDAFTGLIAESTFAHAPLVLSSLGVPKALLRRIPELFGNQRKIKDIHLPLLVIHGERDEIIPVEHGQMLFDASPSANKRIWRVPGAGHNDLVFYNTQQYVETIQTFVNRLAT